jgi:protein TonB
VTQVHAKTQIATKTLPQVEVKTQILNKVVQNATKEPKKVEIVKVESTPKYSEKEIDDWKIDFKNRARQKIESNKQYPSLARNSGIEGTIRVSFTINKNGTVSNLSAGEGNTLLKKSALKAINDSTPFHVSDKLSEYMPMQMSVPLEFKLEE